jgi:adenylyltransferase/sulfurtransferase
VQVDWAAQYCFILLRQGLGQSGIIDDDRVDISNLQRQVLHRTEDVGRLKVESAKEQLLALDPNLTVVEHEGRLNPENVIDLLTGWDNRCRWNGQHPYSVSYR